MKLWVCYIWKNSLNCYKNQIFKSLMYTLLRTQMKQKTIEKWNKNTGGELEK